MLEHVAELVWQSRFHDHIIRNTKEMNNIANYITKNIASWKVEKIETPHVFQWMLAKKRIISLKYVELIPKGRVTSLQFLPHDCVKNMF